MARKQAALNNEAILFRSLMSRVDDPFVYYKRKGPGGALS